MVFSCAGRLHANLDILTERGQELHQTANAESFQNGFEKSADTRRSRKESRQDTSLPPVLRSHVTEDATVGEPGICALACLRHACMAIGVPYCSRNPEATVLYRLLADELETFLARRQECDRPVPVFVEREFRAFLDCGVLARGFLRLYCPDCGRDRLLAFSCKARVGVDRAPGGAWRTRRLTWWIVSFRP